MCRLYWKVRAWLWRLRYGEPTPLTNAMITREALRILQEEMDKQRGKQG